MKTKRVELGKILKSYRIQEGMTQSELANKLKFSVPQFVSLMENGRAKVPLKVLGELIVILKIPQAEVMEKLVEIYEVEARLEVERSKKKFKLK